VAVCDVISTGRESASHYPAQDRARGPSLKISDLGRAADTKPVTIRFYEKIGILPPPQRTGGNQRQYTGEHVQRLTFIRRLRSLGFELSEVRSLLDVVDRPRDAEICDALPAHWRTVEHKLALLLALREELEQMINNGPDSDSATRLVRALTTI
jgi:DNA-binding transcriptional MerR regulator